MVHCLNLIHLLFGGSTYSIDISTLPRIFQKFLDAWTVSLRTEYMGSVVFLVHLRGLHT